jgi:hypothetical protein
MDMLGENVSGIMEKSIYGSGEYFLKLKKEIKSWLGILFTLVENSKTLLPSPDTW